MAASGGKTGDDGASELGARRAPTANRRAPRRERRLATGTVAPDLKPSDAVDPREVLRMVFGGERPHEDAPPEKTGDATMRADASVPDHVHVICSCRRHGAASAHGTTTSVVAPRRAR